MINNRTEALKKWRQFVKYTAHITDSFMAVYTILLLGKIELQLVNAPLAVAIKLSLLINSLSNNIMILVIDVQMHHRLRSNHPRTKSFFCIPVTGKRVRANKKSQRGRTRRFSCCPRLNLPAARMCKKLFLRECLLYRLLHPYAIA